jgi:hypothetical protein
MRSIGDSGTLGEFAALLKFTAAISQMIALRIVLAWVIAPPFLIEKAGLIMTLKCSKNQLSLLRIAPTSSYFQWGESIDEYEKKPCVQNERGREIVLR